MEFEPEAGDLVGADGSEILGGQRLGIGGMIGLAPCPLDSGDIGQVGKRGRRREAGDEIGKASAVVHQHRRAWRLGQRVGARHRLEEVLADDALDHRKGRAERIDHADDDIVAIDGEAAWRRLAVGTDQAGGHGDQGIA